MTWAEVEARQVDRRKAIFTKMCELAHTDAKGLTDLPIDECERLFMQAAPDVDCDRVKLRFRLLEFAGLT